MNPYHYQRVIGPGLDLSGLNLGLASGAPAAAWPAAFDPRTAAQLAAAAQRQQQQHNRQQQQPPPGAAQLAAAATAAAWAGNGAGRGHGEN